MIRQDDADGFADKPGFPLRRRFVLMKTRMGGQRVVDLLSGKQLPLPLPAIVAPGAES
jgi:hypothetical protein